MSYTDKQLIQLYSEDGLGLLRRPDCWLILHLVRSRGLMERAREAVAAKITNKPNAFYDAEARS